MDGKPNVIVLSADSLSQAYFSDRATRLGETVDGTVFTDAVATASDTNSAMPGLAAGVYSDTVSGWGLPEGDDRPVTLAEQLQAVGYDCGLWTDNFLFGEEYNYTDGFDYGNAGKPTWKKSLVNVIKDYFPDAALRASEAAYFRLFKPAVNAVQSDESFYLSAEELNREATEWLQQRSDGNYFLRIHYMDPHHPYEPPQEYVAEIEAETGFSRSELGNLSRRHIKSGGEDVTEEELAAIRAVYDASCEYLFDEVDAFVRDLVERGAFDPDEDVFVFTADHGEALNPEKHGMMGHVPPAFWEEIVNVPLVVSHPDWSPGHVDEQVSLIDLVPTVLDAAGVDVPETTEGEAAVDPLELRRETALFVSEWRSDEGTAWNAYRGARSESAKLFGARLRAGDRCVATSLTDGTETVDSDVASESDLVLSDEHEPLLAAVRERGGAVSGSGDEVDAGVEDHLRNLGYVD
ncbi:sulfatase-like hydrolase/transferase [Natrinema sp. HArc-T2]|uniref:sulfatase-like hydrolase/transferase n=1 Tax=Natrinema sp. HArc-T2 TaxID=3242701 RepID=UPI00359EBDB0